MFSREGVVSGVTTAAVIWILAAIGAAIGLGLYHGAMALALLTVAVLVGVEILESSVKWLTRGVHRRQRGLKRRRGVRSGCAALAPAALGFACVDEAAAEEPAGRRR